MNKLELNPFQLVSLMDLLRISAEEFISLGEYLATLWKWLASSKNFPMNEEQNKFLKQTLSQLKKHCVMLNLPVSITILSKAIDNLPEGERELEILVDVVKSEIGSKMFLFIPSQRVKYYDWSLPMEMQGCFPNSSKELIRAGKCYAKGEFTACVFHSMRAAEIGLRSLATHLNVIFPFPIELADWKNIIDKVESEIKAKQQLPKGKSKDEELRFFSETATHFRYFKDAFRIFVAHARAIYDEEEASSIMERTGEFLKSLSGKIMEPDS